jgi:CheY-like chemotaxis protein
MTPAMRNEHLVILLAEDDDGHASLIQRNLKRAGFVNEIVRVRDGQEALDYVRGEGAFAARPPDTPLLLLLDINMPKVDGVGVLKAVKADSKLVKLPVIMLTTTDDPREVDRCYQLGCSVYITKPVQYQDFVDALSRLGMFLEIIQVPGREST